jgi:hypothetical protein
MPKVAFGATSRSRPIGVPAIANGAIAEGMPPAEQIHNLVIRTELSNGKFSQLMLQNGALPNAMLDDIAVIGHQICNRT